MDIIKHSLIALIQENQSAIDTNDRRQMIMTFERTLHILCKLLVLIRWINSDNKLHEIDAFNQYFRESFKELRSTTLSLIKSKRSFRQQETNCPDVPTSLDVLLNGTLSLPDESNLHTDMSKLIERLNNKIWKLSSSQEKYTDEQLIELIKSGKIGPDERIATREMKKWINVKDSIYQFYIKEGDNK